MESVTKSAWKLDFFANFTISQNSWTSEIKNKPKMEGDVIKEQLKVLRRASSGKDSQACDEAIYVLNDYFDIPRKPAEISKS